MKKPVRKLTVAEAVKQARADLRLENTAVPNGDGMFSLGSSPVNYPWLMRTAKSINWFASALQQNERLVRGRDRSLLLSGQYGFA